MRKPLAGFGRPFWIFLFSENLYDCGLYVFVLLYNLYLLDLGYREDFLGYMTSAMTAGSILGTLPAAFIARRFGMKSVLICGSATVACLCALRATVPGRPALLAAAFAMGLVSSIWAVSLVPVVAALTSEKDRPLGYSLWTGWGVGLGVLCGALAGYLPGWLGGKRPALLLGAFVAFLSPWVLLRLQLGKPDPGQRRIFPRTPFVVRYLAAYTVFHFAIGMFNPFFSAYFSRQLHMPVNRIGVVFSGAQLATLVALLLAPSVLRKFGAVPGIAGMQLGMAVSLALLATGPPPIAAGVLYAAFMSFQVMTEPGVFTMLMGNVDADQRAGASALNFFAMHAPQAAAAGISGVAVAHFGYQPVLAVSSAFAAAAAWLFWRLLRLRTVDTAKTAAL
jgi:predicted MFS family arabinose efflux permease